MGNGEDDGGEQETDQRFLCLPCVISTPSLSLSPKPFDVDSQGSY